MKTSRCLLLVAGCYLPLVPIFLESFSKEYRDHLQFALAQQPPDKLSVNVQATLDALVNDEDTDGDKKITIDDPHVLSTDRGDKRFWMSATDHQQCLCPSYR